MKQNRLTFWVQNRVHHRISPSFRVVLLYIAIGIVWLTVTVPLIWKFGWRPQMLKMLRILYFVVSGFILYLILKRERKLADSRHDYTRLLSHLLEPVLIHQDGLIVNANLHAVQVLEASCEDELVGMPILDVVHPDYRAVVQKRIHDLETGRSTKLLEEKFVTLKGSIMDVEISGIPITFRGQPAIMVIFRDITERNHQQAMSHASERRLRTLIDAMPDQICFVDDEGRWIEANSMILRSVGIDSGVFRGKTAQELAEVCDPRYRELFLQNADYAPETYKTVTRFDYEYTRPDGELAAFEITRVPVERDDGSTLGLVVIVRDVTESRLSTLRLKESEQRYRSLFENDGDMVVSLGIDGSILSANPSTEHTLGYTPNEIIGIHYRELVASDFRETSYERFLQGIQGGPQVTTTRLIHKDGRLIDVHEKKIPIVFDGTVAGFFCIVRDVTRQKAAEELLIKSERLSAVGQMAAGIAHEIRNPLTVLKGFVQLMQSPGSGNGFYLDVMKGEFERIEMILNELLVFAKPTERLLERYDCAHLVEDVIHLMTPEANLRNIVISQWVTSGSHDILCEKNRIKQVLVNVVKNAIEAMTQGGDIVVGIRIQNEQTVSIFVRDNGPGIAADEIMRIGEPFYTTKDTGTGLGLMVSRKIVEAHQGVLNIYSTQGEGTEVEILIPRVAYSDDEKSAVL